MKFRGFLASLFLKGAGAASWKAKLGVGLGLLVAIGIALASVYFVGYGKGKNISEVQISKYEQKVATLNGRLIEAQAHVTTRVVTQYVTDIAYQDRILYQNRDVIRTVIAPRADGITLTNGWIYGHNQLAGGKLINNLTMAGDASPSGISDNDVLGVIAENYAISYKNNTRLEALQKWVDETYKASEAVANERSK